MRTEMEIREYLTALRKARVCPCSCRGTEHEMKCIRGGDMMDSAIGELEWVLGDTKQNELHTNIVKAFP